ncbi:MAG: nucleotide exchange factor GrpE [bacterium]|nr:nucleotide exchange factor GrpE [bacterium]
MAKSKEEEAVNENENGDEIYRVLDELANLKQDSALTTERLADLSNKVALLDSISADTRELLRFREVITGVVNKLYKELDEEKRDPRSGILKPVVNDLILFYDDLVEVRRDAAKELGEKHITTSKLDTLVEGLLEVLYRMDVKPYKGDGESLDLARQKTIRVENVTDEERDKRIIKVSKTGFVWPEGVLRREGVVVGKYVSGEDENSENGSSGRVDNGETEKNPINQE